MPNFINIRSVFLDLLRAEGQTVTAELYGPFSQAVITVQVPYTYQSP